MAVAFDGKLVVAISSRALFDLEESNRVFEQQGIEAYAREEKWDNFADCFARAREALEGKSKDRASWTADIVRYTGFSQQQHHLTEEIFDVLLEPLASEAVDRVVVRTAAHEREPVLDPVGDAEAQDLGVELGHDLRLVHH